VTNALKHLMQLNFGKGKENNGCHHAAHHTTVMALTRPDGIV